MRNLPALSLCNNDFQVFAGHHQRGWPRDVAALEQRRNILCQRGLTGGIERRERLVRRPVEVAENLYPVRRSIFKLQTSGVCWKF